MDDMSSPASVAFPRRLGAWALAAIGAIFAACLYSSPSGWSFAIGILGEALLVVAWLLVTRPGYRRGPLRLLALALILAATIPPSMGSLVQPVFIWIASLASALSVVVAVLSWMMARRRPRKSMIAATVVVLGAAWSGLVDVSTLVAVVCVIAVWVGWAVEVAGRQMAGGAIIAGAVSWRLVVAAAVVFGVVMVIAGFAYGRSESFKIECGAHKLTGVSIGWFKNTVCDADFAIKSSE